MFSLQGKKALVTGATGGIGGAIAASFAQAGAQLALSGTNAGKLEALKSQFSGAHTLVCNLQDMQAVETLVPQAETALGGLDILVCNAGVTRDALTIRMKDEDWQQVMDINLTATFRLCRAALKGMMKRRAGRVIVITSVVGHSGNFGQANYSAAKAGLAGMCRSLALEMAARGVTVNCIAPGFIATPMTDVLNEEQKARITGNIPQGRMGSPQDIAAGALYLASDEAGYVTGQTLHINGGLYLP